MHIAFFSDQHPGTLGGLQVSLGTQRKHLELRGHTVSLCAPDSRRIPTPEYSRGGDVLLRSTQVGEQSFCLAGERFDRAIDAAFSDKPPVDVVHVQADVWGAWNGYRFARRHQLPLVHTMHTNVEVGLPAMLPFSRAVTQLLFAAQHRYLDARRVRSLAAYTRAFADRADLIIAPSQHFAQHLAGYGVTGTIHVLPTGVDDEALREVRAEPRACRPRPILVWPGRVSAEKRLGELLEALALASSDAELHVYGTGGDLGHCRRLAATLGLGARVRFHGAVSHRSVLRAMHQADAVVQSSLGYESQGLTAYEAVSLGTPVILRDHEVSRELPERLRYTAENGSLAAFAHALDRAVKDVARRDTPRRPSDAFLQSALARRAEGLYELAREHHAAAARSHRLGAARAGGSAPPLLDDGALTVHYTRAGHERGDQPVAMSDVRAWAVARADELPGSEPGQPFGPDAIVYKVHGKMFLLLSEMGPEPFVTVKARPADSATLQAAFADILPGYHMNKRHWISLREGGSLARQLVADLVTESYLLVVEGLPRRQRPVDPATFGQPAPGN